MDLLIHPNGKSRSIGKGFCWFGFFLPMVWAVTEGLWRPFAFSLLGYEMLMLSSAAARHFDNPVWSLAGLAYFAVMFVFGSFGKDWLIADMLKNGYVVRPTTLEI